MLSRHSVEASFKIIHEDIYTPEEKELHAKLINELIDERKARGI